MFVEDLVEDFYKLITGKRLLLLVNYDIDAICSCKILQALFRCENILYTLVPVQGVEDLAAAYEKHSEQMKHVLLINCGGTIDIVETLQPEEDVIFFIADSHKPTDVCNIYSSGQVRIFGKAEEDEGIPDFNEIFVENESDESDPNEEDEEEEDNEEADQSNVPRNNRNNAEERILKRREKRLWEEKRNRLMFEYTQFSYYGRASSMVIFDIVWHLGKDSLDALWWAIVGVTYQVVLGLVVEFRYTNELTVLQLHMSRLVKSETDEKTAIFQAPTLKIASQKDLRLALYRHWTVQASLRYSLCTAIKLRLWTIRGEKHLQQLLAEIGLPLSESKQRFCAMDITLRRDFFSMMEKVAAKYELNELIYPSFTLRYGYRNCFQASDYVYGMLALMETSSRNKSMGDCFSEALDSLSRSKADILDVGIESAKRLLTCTFKQVQSLLDMKQVISAGPFLYFALQEGSLDVRFFSCVDCLNILAKCTLRAHHSTSRNRRAGYLPLIASAPSYPPNDTCIILGIPPVSEIIPRSFFGKAFIQAAEMIHIKPYVFFDNSVIRINSRERPKFFDALASILS